MAAAALLVLAGCGRSADETTARGLARRIVPQYAANIRFVEKADTVEHYRFYSESGKLVIEGTDAGSMARGLNHYLREFCLVTVGPNLSDSYVLPNPMPVVPLRKARADFNLNKLLTRYHGEHVSSTESGVYSQTCI